MPVTRTGQGQGDMAVYFDHRIEAPESSGAPSQLTWHPALPLLAVASSSRTGGGNVDVYLQQVKNKYMLVHQQHHVSIMCNVLIKVCKLPLYVVMQGEHVESCHIERPHQPTVLCWHPTKPVLALGWENGDALLLTHPSGDQTALSSAHSVCITLLEWSSSGSRLVTGDQVSVEPECCFSFLVSAVLFRGRRSKPFVSSVFIL